MPRNAGPDEPEIDVPPTVDPPARRAPDPALPRQPPRTRSQAASISPSPPVPNPPSASQQRPVAPPPQPQEEPEDFPCPLCPRSFPTKIGLGVHRRKAHIEEANEDVIVPQGPKRRWNPEEQRLVAREEALATVRGGVRFMNVHLQSMFPDRTLEGIKGMRKNPVYKALVEAAIQDLRAVPEAVPSPEPAIDDRDSSSASSTYVSADEETQTSAPGVSPPRSSPERWSDIYASIPAAIRKLIPVVGQVSGWESEKLVEVAEKLLNGEDIQQECCAWYTSVFPPPGTRRAPQRLPREGAPVNVPKKQQRRRDYARVQTMFKKNMSRAAKEVLDGPCNARAPSLSDMSEYWRPVLTQESVRVPPVPGRARDDLMYVWHPVTCEETVAVTTTLASAPGVDGVSPRLWRSVPASVKSLFFNIVLAIGSFPEPLLVSRTVFLPKKASSSTPADFRPISIASVAVRHLHKILAERLREAGLVDVRQRCLDDGCAENITALAALLADARSELKEIHVSSLDFAKAFDSVSHDAISVILGEAGLPASFVEYIARTYANSSTVLEVEGQRSIKIAVKRGIRQGDPLSSLLFCLVVNRVLRAMPGDVGYEMGGARLNALAFADDIILISSTRLGMEKILRIAEEKGQEVGLLLNSSKCVSLSIMPAGKAKKYKVLTTPQFHLADGSPIRQLSPSQEWSYLGVDFRPLGPKRAGGRMGIEIDRMTRAPLKPQQRLKILRCFLIPRFYHQLVLSGTTLGKLRALDKQVRAAIRKWLRLPADIPTGYFHTSCRDGGLGIPSFLTTVPGLLHGRLKVLAKSSLPAIRAIAQSTWVLKRSEWAERALTREGVRLDTTEKRAKWWRDRLYNSVDGRELRECGKTSVSNQWIDARSYGVPGRDYVQYHHVRVNCLPTRIRTSRGVRRATAEVNCRAGCQSTETAAHVIQACFRTHGGRVKRHNAVCKVLAGALRDAGWAVAEEPQIATSRGRRKPDLVAEKGEKVCVVDAQVVSGATSLDDAHERKRQYYEGNPDVVAALKRGRPQVQLAFSSCTLSWRGVWSSKSVDFLLGMGLSKRLLAGITTRVLQGSHTNWTRWNQMTGTEHQRGGGAPRAGVG